MRRINNLFEYFLFAFSTILLYLIFFVNLPMFELPHGLLAMNDLANFSSTQLSSFILFGSITLCAVLGALLLKWIPAFTAGMMANLWASTFFLLWVDSMFALTVQRQSTQYLNFIVFGLLFLYLFFFTLHYLGPSKGGEPASAEPSKACWVSYWLGGWMVFYLFVSLRLFFHEQGNILFQRPLAMGFCALCFLNYLLFLNLKKSKEGNLRLYTRIGSITFSLWFLTLLAVEIGQKWFH